MAQIVTARDLDRVRQRVSVVQQRPTPGLALIRGDHLGLDAHACSNSLLERQRVQSAAAEPVVLGELTEPATPFALRQGRERSGVTDDSGRLPVRPHQVLAPGQVDAGLPADGSVDLPQERRRDLHDGHPPVVDGCGEPGDVGHHATADADHAVGPGQAPLGELGAERLDRRHGLLVLTVTDVEDPVITTGVDLDRNARLGHHRDAAGRGREQRGQFADCTVTDHDRVGAPVGQLDRNGDACRVRDQCVAHRSILATSSATERALMPSTSMTVPATSE